MTPDRAIILAFWQRNQHRFVELTGEELQSRSGFGPHDWQVSAAIRDGYIISELLHKKGILIYGLTYRGKQTCKAMLEQPDTTKRRRLTAKPPEEAK